MSLRSTPTLTRLWESLITTRGQNSNKGSPGISGPPNQSSLNPAPQGGIFCSSHELGLSYVITRATYTQGWADGRQTARRTRRLTRVVGEGGGTILSRAGRAGGADVSQPRRAARRLGMGGGVAGLGPGCPRGGGGGAGARAPVHPGPPPAGP